jgi:chemotaxis protein methyltransferase CheR
MLAEAVAGERWQKLAACIPALLGLRYPPERLAELQRGVLATTRELAIDDVADCVERLLSAAPNSFLIQTLADHLTVNETYFFREPKTFDAIADAVLTPLIAERRGHAQRLRLWSAACSTGEEPYTLAIQLQRLLPDWQDWDVSILATDINRRALKRAAAGIYNRWSFRQAAPALLEHYFRRTEDDHYALTDPIRQRVSFRRMNLVADFPPDAACSAMDLILCRNLLMYFAPAQMRTLIARLYRALAPGGWLAVSPSECSHELFAGFDTFNLGGATLYRRPVRECATGGPEHVALPMPPLPLPLPLPSLAVEIVAAEPPSPVPWPAPAAPAASIDAQSLSQQARKLADQGQLAAALICSERWVAADKVDPAAHYLHAMILQEQGQRVAARHALGRALYLNADFVLAHLALAHLARADGRSRDAERHFGQALRVLRALPPHEIVPDSDGLTVGRLIEMAAMLESTSVPAARVAGERA